MQDHVNVMKNNHENISRFLFGLLHLILLEPYMLTVGSLESNPDVQALQAPKQAEAFYI